MNSDCSKQMSGGASTLGTPTLTGLPFLMSPLPSLYRGFLTEQNINKISADDHVKRVSSFYDEAIALVSLLLFDDTLW